MNFDKEDLEVEGLEVEDQEVQAALKNFRASVHAWSEEEYGRAHSVRSAQRSGLSRWMASPVLGWGMAAVLAVAAVAVPVSVHHERQVAAAEHAAQLQHERQAAEAAARLAASSVDDEYLLSHVDSDIAQATPDAMEPLASLMSDPTAQ
jgi:hypothetical protein